MDGHPHRTGKSHAHVSGTGGAGFIGSHIAETLVARGDRVRVLDNLSTGHRENLDGFRDQIEFIEGDVADPQVTARAVEGVDCVFHEAALASVPLSVERPLASHAACATGTVTLLDAARRAGVRRVVYAASSAAYGDRPGSTKRETDLPAPLSPYAAAKLAGELYCQAFWSTFGLETVAIRYFNVFGPRQDPHSQYSAVIPLLITAMLAGRQPVIYGDGRQSRDFSFVANVVHANLLAADAPGVAGRTINVADGRSIDLLTLIDALNRLAGHQRQAAICPAAAGRRPRKPGRHHAWPARCWATSRKLISRTACGDRSTIIGRLPGDDASRNWPTWNCWPRSIRWSIGSTGGPPSAPAWQPAEKCRALGAAADGSGRHRCGCGSMPRWSWPPSAAPAPARVRLVNALVGAEVVQTGRSRPTTTRPTLVCRAGLTPEMLGIDPPRWNWSNATCRRLRDLVVVDCPDPDTTEEASESTHSPRPAHSRSLTRSRRQQLGDVCGRSCPSATCCWSRPRSRNIAALGWPTSWPRRRRGAHLVFVQTHADLDDDIRDDWRQVLEADLPSPIGRWARG